MTIENSVRDVKRTLELIKVTTITYSLETEI
jgi:hypothetical protein